MRHNIEELLKQLQTVRPDEGFVLRTREAILAEHPAMSLEYLFSTYKLAAAGLFAFAAAVLFLVASLNLVPSGPAPRFSSLENTEALQQELDNMHINIQLDDISFQTDANRTITAAITEIADTKTKHLNPDTLRSEGNPAVPGNAEDPKIDQLLQTILF